MSDFLLNLSANRTASAVVKGIGLPVPLPQPLERDTGPWNARPLEGRIVVLASCESAQLVPTLESALTAFGADVVTGAQAAHGIKSEDIPEGQRPHALVFDATGMDDLSALDDLYSFFHAQVRSLSTCGRAIALVRPPQEAGTMAQAAARRAVEGFMRSLGRELGRKGATAQTVYVGAGADDRTGPLLHFLLSPRSAYISGQALHLSAQVEGGPGARLEKSLDGKVAMVTGGARGIGAATARALAREGAKVIVLDRPAEMADAESVAQAIGGEALGCDITSGDAADTIRSHLSERHGGLDIMIHNAGVTRDKTLAKMDEDRWQMVLDVNLRALIRINEALLDILRDNGRIVCVSSIGGIAGNFGQTNYAASKAGIIGYIEALGPALASRGIAVNAVAPGFIETEMTAAMPFGTREAGRRLSNLSQGGLPEDVAETITYLSSPGAAGLCGQVVRVCGGGYIGA